MKDPQLSTCSEESTLQQLGAKANQSSSVQLTSAAQPQGSSSRTQRADVGGGRKKTQSVQKGPRGVMCLPQTTQETELQKSTHVDKCNKDTPGTSQSVCVSKPYASFFTQEAVLKGDHMTEEGDSSNQSEKPKRSRNRRKRREGVGQQVVGMPTSPSASPPVLLWFRRDLRLCDNPALIGSLENGAPVIPVFIWSPEEEEGPGITVAMGGACKLTSVKACAKLPLEAWLSFEATTGFITCLQNYCLFSLQANTGCIKLCPVSVHLWSALAAILSSSRQMELAMVWALLCVPLRS